jgi:cytoskeletal protein CcmA (bactofilin family)
MLFRKKRPAGNDNAPTLAQPTTIGSAAVFEGSLVTEGEAYVEGTVRGLLKADYCVVGANGRVEGEIEAEEVSIAGRVIGPVSARHVHLRPGAHVDGDITSDTIAIDSGAKLSGAVWNRDSGADDQETAVSLPAANEPRFAPVSLWDQVRDDDNRPLRAVRLTR